MQQRITFQSETQGLGRATGIYINDRIPVSRGFLCTDVGRKWKWATSYHCMVPVQELGLFNNTTSGQNASATIGDRGGAK